MWLYRLLLNLYPARFREEYARQMEIGFRDDYREANGVGPRAAFWIKALKDLAISIPAELAREFAQDLRYTSRL